MREQAEKVRVFRALHERSAAFIIPNPWDAGAATAIHNDLRLLDA
jgi:2-methylisocitrate lyase-like PEP mutase family enzyme